MRTNNDLYPISKIIELAQAKGVNFGDSNPENRIRYYVKFGLLHHAKRKSFNGEAPGAAFKLEVVDKIVDIEKKRSKGKSIAEQKVLLQNQPKIKGKQVKTDRVADRPLPNQRSSFVPRVAIGLTILILILFLGSLFSNLIQSPSTNQSVLGTQTQNENGFVKVAKAIVSPLSYLNLGILKVIKTGDSLDPLGLTNISDYIQRDGDKLVFTNKIDADLVNTKSINGYQINNKENSFVTLNSEGNLEIPGEIKTEIDWEYIKNKPDLAGSVNLVAGSNIRISKNSLTGAFTISSTSTSTTVTSSGSSGGSGTITAVVAGTGLTGGGSSGSVTLGVNSTVTLQGNTFNGASQLVQLDGVSQLPAVSGILLNNLDANNIASGTLADVRLTVNVTLQGNSFNGSSQLVKTNGLGELTALSGINLTNLNATNIASGTLGTGVTLALGSLAYTGSLGDAYIDNTITVSNYLPLAGGILSGGLTVSGVTGLTDGDIPNTITLDGTSSINAGAINSGTLGNGSVTLALASFGSITGTNGASQLVQLNGSIQLPAVSGALLTNINASNVASGSLGDAYVDDTITASNYLPLAGGTMAGNIDFNNNLALNIGNSGTDFTSSGGLNLAGNLAANNLSSLSGTSTTTNNPYNFLTDQAATNLVVNPSFETDAASWSGNGGTPPTLTRLTSTTTAYVGSASLQVSKNPNAVDDGVKTSTMAVSINTSYVGSVYIRTNNSTGNTIQVCLVGNSSGSTCSNTYTLDTTSVHNFVRIAVAKKSNGTDATFYLLIKDPTNAQNLDFTIDAAQLEQISTSIVTATQATSYLDGSLGPGYSWSGTAHASTSSRTAGIKYLGGGGTTAADAYFQGPVYFEGGNGDINQDGAVNFAGDSLLLSRYFADSAKLTPMQLGLADFNGDGKVSLDDQATINTLAFSGSDNKYDLKRRIGALYGASSLASTTSPDIFTVAGGQTITGVNVAGNSLSVLNMSGTLSAFDGSDTFRGLYLNYTNANHTGTTNIVNGIDIASITEDADATETAINIGSGWDYQIKSAGLSSTHGFTVQNISQQFGSLSESGASASFNSYFGEEFSRERADVGGAGAAVNGALNWGDATELGTAWAVNNNCTESILDNTLNGVSRLNTGSTASCSLYNSSTVAGTANTLFASGNRPVIYIKTKPGTLATTHRVMILGISDAVSGSMTSPTNGIYFTNLDNAGTPAAGTNWYGKVRSGGTESSTSSCGAINTGAGQYALLKIVVESTSSVKFYIDTDASDGISFTLCGTLTTNIPTANLNLYLSAATDNSGILTLDLDFIRIWQDDSPFSEQAATTSSVVDGGTTQETTTPTENFETLKNSQAEVKTFNTAAADSVGNATTTLSAGEKFTWVDSVGKIVASISDLGEAVFSKVTTTIANVGKLVFGEIAVKKGSQSAGIGEISADQNEVIIQSSKVKDDSLINLTADSEPDGVLYVKAKTAGESFVVGIKRFPGTTSPQKIDFNWLIVNQE